MKTGPGLDVHITKRTALLLLLDIIATYLSYWLASILTHVKGEVFVNNEIYFVLGILAFINVVVLATFRLYNNLWEYASIDEVIQIVGATVLGTLGGAVFLWIIGTRLPIRVFVVSCFLLIFFMGIRFVFRFMRQKGRAIASSQRTCDRPRTLVVGAGETGSLAIGRMASKDPLMPGIPIVATDDDPAKRGQRIHGVKVSGGTPDIVDLVDRYDIEQIVVAIPSSTPEERKRIYGECTKTDCRLRTLPNVRALSLDEIGDVSLRDVDVADLLGREEIVLNTRAVSGYIAGETVLVTGGGGSIGSELCRQLCTVAPARIVIFDIYENDAYMLRNELLSEYDDIDIIIEIGNVCDKERVNEVFAKYRPGAVFHAAAHKHVPLMEHCPREAVHNNVFGTLNAVRAADAYGAARFIFISTDKAVNPTSVMGATKRMGEMIVQYYARTSKTIFTAVRFGNVLGSNGSVIPVFQRHIAKEEMTALFEDVVDGEVDEAHVKSPVFEHQRPAQVIDRGKLAVIVAVAIIPVREQRVAAQGPALAVGTLVFRPKPALLHALEKGRIDGRDLPGENVAQLRQPLFPTLQASPGDAKAAALFRLQRFGELVHAPERLAVFLGDHILFVRHRPADGFRADVKTYQICHLLSPSVLTKLRFCVIINV